MEKEIFEGKKLFKKVFLLLEHLEDRGGSGDGLDEGKLQLEQQCSEGKRKIWLLF